jgi:hypothetical protein
MFDTADEVDVSLPFCSTMNEEYLSMINYELEYKDCSALGDSARITTDFLNKEKN